METTDEKIFSIATHWKTLLGTQKILDPHYSGIPLKKSDL